MLSKCQGPHWLKRVGFNLHTVQIPNQITWWLFQELPKPSEDSVPPGPLTPTAPQEEASPVPSPSQSTRRRLIRLSSLERQRLSTLNITPESETEPPPKPPRSCSALARQALEGSFVGWGVPGRSPQGDYSFQIWQPGVWMG